MGTTESTPSMAPSTRWGDARSGANIVASRPRSYRQCEVYDLNAIMSLAAKAVGDARGDAAVRVNTRSTYTLGLRDPCPSPWSLTEERIGEGPTVHWSLGVVQLRGSDPSHRRGATRQEPALLVGHPRPRQASCRSRPPRPDNSATSLNASTLGTDSLSRVNPRSDRTLVPCPSPLGRPREARRHCAPALSWPPRSHLV